MKNCRSSLVIWVALAAIMCFTPPAWCADSTTLTGIAGTIGHSKSAGGSFDKLATLPKTIWQWFPGRGNMLLYKECVSIDSSLRTSGLSSVGVFNGQPCMWYTAFVDDSIYNAFVNSDGVVVKAWEWP